MGKAVILFLYGVTLYVTLSRWYGAGNSGMPEPKVVAPASYLFGILALTSDFLQGFPIILAAMLTFLLYLERPPTSGTKTKAPMNLGKNQTPAVQSNLKKAQTQGGVVLRKSNIYVPPNGG